MLRHVTEIPTRKVTDPLMLRAMAHPVRLKLINALILLGPSTATELGEHLGETPANCSWHLRQLSKYGFIEEATELPAHGRNRPWRWVPKGTQWGSPEDSAEMAIAGREVSDAMLAFELSERNAWEERKSAEPLDWQTAPFTNQSIAWLTTEELQAIDDTIRALYLDNAERLTDPSTRPEGARPVRLVAWGVPAR